MTVIISLVLFVQRNNYYSKMNHGVLNKFVLNILDAVIMLQDIYKGYRQVSNIKRTIVGNKIVDHSDVVGASPVGAAPTTSSFST